MREADFTLFYDGPILSDGQMDVRDLAPALLALGGLVEEANRVVNGQSAKVRVQVKTFKDGSFGVDLLVFQDLSQRLAGWASGFNIATAKDILEWIGLLSTPTATLIWVIKKLRGRKPKRASRLENGNIVLELPDGERLELTPQVAKLFQDLTVRELLDKVVAPIRRDGIDVLGTKEGNNTRSELAKKHEAGWFVPPTTSDIPSRLLRNWTETRFFSIVSLSFKEDNKWRLSDGQVTLPVLISDQSFLDQVDDGETFSKGDMLEVELEVRQLQTSEGLKTEYEATKVIAHHRIVKQIPLPLDEE